MNPEEVNQTEGQAESAKAQKMKKFKILLIVDIVILVALAVLMFVLKGQYNETAKGLYKDQSGKYLELSNAALHDQWKSVDQFGQAWRLVYETIKSGDKSEKGFNARLDAIVNDKESRERQLSYIYSAAGIPEKAQMKFSELGLAEGSILVSSEGGVKTVACGKGCSITFTFAKGKLAKMDYSALSNYDSKAQFTLPAPAPFSLD